MYSPRITGIGDSVSAMLSASFEYWSSSLMTVHWVTCEVKYAAKAKPAAKIATRRGSTPAGSESLRRRGLEAPSVPADRGRSGALGAEVSSSRPGVRVAVVSPALMSRPAV